MIQIFAYCRCNLGDDLFIQTLLRRYPDKKFFLRAAPKYTEYLIKEPNLSANGALSFNASRVVGKVSKKLLRFIHSKKTERFDAAVRIGGSVFIERDNADNNFFPEKNKHFFIIGANFGPYKTQAFLDSRKKKIKSSESCCFRDKYSYNLFADIPQVSYAPDVLFGCPFLPRRTEGDHVGISVIDLNNHSSLREYAADYEQGIKNICDHWTGRDKTVKLLCFCNDEGDTKVADRIALLCNSPGKIERVVYSGDTVRFLSELNSCETIYATRFHAMILGWAMGKNVVPVIYSNKQTNVIDDIGFKGPVWNVTQDKEISDDILYPKNGRLDEKLISELKTKSETQFSGLDRFFNEN